MVLYYVKSATVVLFIVHCLPYNKAIKESARRKEVYIMKKTVQNILLTLGGAAILWGAGWLFLIVAGALSQLIS